ncbi:MAG: autotransporter-associated beta strand repeat-containing protein [Opitutaceae bacterium]|nr:autotransporter-associated beta strand repeat-containing protein [Opitutaceae bacterium]
MGSGRANTVLVNRATPGSADYALGTLSLGASTLAFNTGPQISGAHTGLVRLAALDLSAGNNNQPVVLTGNATLAIGSAAILSNNSLSKRLQLDGTALANTLGPVSNGPGTGILSLIKAGLGRWTLTGDNTYTGTTTITQGELALATPTLPDAANVSITNGATLHLAFTGTDFIGSLTLGGTPATPGTWGSLTSTAPNRTTHLTGPGTVTILPAAYATWANTHALGTVPTQRAPLADPDADGLPNVLEFALGSSPSSPSSANLSSQVSGLSPQVSSFTFTFPRSPASLGLVPLTVEWSPDLVTWNSLPIGAANSGPDARGITVAIAAQSAAPDVVTVTFPASLSPGGRLFTRLRATSF